MLQVRRGSTHERNPEAVAAGLAAQVCRPEASVAFVFASPMIGPGRLAGELAEAFAPVPVFGCTTAIEIGEDGFFEGGAVAMTLASEKLRVGAGLATGLAESALSSGRRATLAAVEALGYAPSDLNGNHHVAVSLIGAWYGQDEAFIAGAAASAPAISFVGGSASEYLSGTRAPYVFAGGLAHQDAGLILLVESDLPFTTLMSEHMIPTERRVVVTASDPAQRLVHELDGKPARAVYADMIGTSEDIGTELSARHPFGYYVGGRPYVRSVVAIDGSSLRFGCAVEEGVVLRQMRPGDLLATTARSLEDAAQKVGGDIGAVVAFHCLGRFFEARARGTLGDLGSILTAYPVIGLNTAGEQIDALHVNHTLTALVLGGDCGA